MEFFLPPTYIVLCDTSDPAVAGKKKAAPTVSLTISDDILQATRLSEAELRQEIALALFQREKLTLAQASSFSGMTRLAFQHLLGSRGLTVHYDVPEYERDLETLRQLDETAWGSGVTPTPLTFRFSREDGGSVL